MMDQETFTQTVREIVSDRLVEHCPEGFDTSVPPLERKTHYYSFLHNVINHTGIGARFLTDSAVAGYHIDDSWEYMQSPAYVQAERQRLLTDLQTTPNIIEFIVKIFRFSA